MINKAPDGNFLNLYPSSTGYCVPSFSLQYQVMVGLGRPDAIQDIVALRLIAAPTFPVVCNIFGKAKKFKYKPFGIICMNNMIGYP